MHLVFYFQLLLSVKNIKEKEKVVSCVLNYNESSGLQTDRKHYDITGDITSLVSSALLQSSFGVICHAYCQCLLSLIASSVCSAKSARTLLHSIYALSVY